MTPPVMIDMIEGDGRRSGRGSAGRGRGFLLTRGADFRYVGQRYGENSAVLEFVADIDGIVSTAST
jgi:hypothetical protein